MKLQVAIDRVDVPAAMEMIRQVEAYADIVEIGTSLIKDFGLENSVGALTRTFPTQDFLADIKTCDEGAYEFRKTYEAGAAVATVMGFSSSATIRACAEVADAFGRDCLIDLLACDAARVRQIAAEFPRAIFCIHLPSDCAGEGLGVLIEEMAGQLRVAAKAPRIAAAGGVQLASVPLLRRCGIEIGIVGSSVTKAADPAAAARALHEAMRE